MISRFSGADGKKKLVEALLSQRIVAGDASVAEALAEKGQLLEFKPGGTMIEQDASDDDVYFIINGKSNVFVNHQQVGTRSSGEAVGEMVVVDPTARRSATVKADKDVLALKVSADDFRAAGEKSVPFWRNVAVIIGQRLREREKFHLPANPTPIMFIGSSVEGLPLAEEIAAAFKHVDVIARPWTTRGVFGPSGSPLNDLMAQVHEADFAIFVFGPDDKVRSRKEEHDAPRDNVVFEMGLFLGHLGRERVFMVHEAGADLKIPSDLTGVNPITYKCKPGCKLADVIGPVCADLKSAISAKGVVTNRLKV